MIIGLTGGIGSGKTTVSDLFHDKGIDIVDADVIAHQLTDKHSELLACINAHFNDEVLNSDGSLNRQRLREIIFTHPEKKQWLEDFLHPKIREAIQQQALTSSSPYCMVVIPLLAEADPSHYTFLDRICVVDCDEDTQRQRASKRDKKSLEHIQAIINSQATRQQRLAISNDLICNDLSISLSELKQQVDELDQRYRTQLA